MNNLPKSAISPLVIAEKLAAADNLTDPGLSALLQSQPRVRELLWFLQWFSAQPGGLEKLSAEVMASFTPQFGPSCLHIDSAALTLEQRAALWKSLPVYTKHQLVPIKSWMEEKDVKCDPSGFESMVQMFRREENSTAYPDPLTPLEKAGLSAAYMQITSAQFRAAILDAAKTLLPQRLRAMCQDAGKWIADAPWYCAKFLDVLFEAMDAHAASIELTLARTEVVSLAFDRLDYAWQGKCLVKIEGDARTGKSEAIKAWASMYPGRARLVATPSSNSLRDLLLAVAESLGLPFTPNVNTSDIKDRVQFIIRHSGLFFLWDECHFLLPANYGRNTSPTRLDWVRTEIIDKGLTVALVCTPQAFKHGVERFQKWTGYNFAQFLGRIMLNITLPNELSQSDLLSVTRIQGSDIPENCHGFIASRAMQSEGYLKAIEAICSRARYIARRDGHPVITLADVELAASEVIPAAPAPARPAPVAAPSARQPLAVKRRRQPAAPAADTLTMEPPLRDTAPAMQAPSRQTTPFFQTT